MRAIGVRQRRCVTRAQPPRRTRVPHKSLSHSAMAAGRKVIQYSYMKMFEIGGELPASPALELATVSCNRGTLSECCQSPP